MIELPIKIALNQINDYRGNLVVLENIEDLSFNINSGILIQLSEINNCIDHFFNTNSIIICLFGSLNILINDSIYILDEPNTALFVPQKFGAAKINSIGYSDILLINSYK